MLNDLETLLAAAKLLADLPDQLIHVQVVFAVQENFEDQVTLLGPLETSLCEILVEGHFLDCKTVFLGLGHELKISQSRLGPVRS